MKLLRKETMVEVTGRNFTIQDILVGATVIVCSYAFIRGCKKLQERTSEKFAKKSK